MDERNLKRPEVLSVRVRSGTRDCLQKLVLYYSEKMGTDVTKGQVLEMLFTEKLKELDI